MKYLCILGGFILCGIIGCTHNHPELPKELYTDSYSVSDSMFVLSPPMKKGTFNFDSIVKSVSYLPLFTNDTILISNISDIKRVKDRLFIADYHIGQIFVFGLDGNILGIIADKGEGPEQYKRICSWDIDLKTGLLYLLDGDLGKVHIYDWNLKLEKVIKLPYNFVDHLSLYENDLFLELGFRERDKDNDVSPNLIRYDYQNNKIIATYFHYVNDKNIRYRTMNPIAFSSYSHKLFYWPPLGNDVYSFHSDSITKMFDYDLGEYEVPLDILTDKISKVQRAMAEKQYAYIERFYEFQDWYYAQISRIRSSAHYFFNKHSQKGFLDVSYMNVKETSKKIMPELFWIADTVCCGYMSPEQYINLQRKEGETLDIENNPVLVFYELKP